MNDRQPQPGELRREVLREFSSSLGWSGLAVLLLVFGTLMAAPTIAQAADRRGLPGTAIGLGMVGCLAVLTLVAVRGSFPHMRRRRSMVRAAHSLGLRQVERFRLSTSQLQLPALGAAGPIRSFECLVAGHRDGRNVFIVDYSIGNGSGYIPMHPRTCAVHRLDARVPALIVEPHSVLGPPEPHTGMTQRSFE